MRGRPRHADAIKRHPLYKTHSSMRSRCADLNDKNYCGRGIRVCKRWDSYHPGFRNFLADMGPKPTPHHTLERIDNDGDYSQENCIWATRTAQAKNKRNNRIPGVSVRELAIEAGIPPKTAYDRLDAGCTITQALDPARRPGSPPKTQYTLDGITSSLGAHAKRVGVVTEHCAHGRVKRGWEVRDAVYTPGKIKLKDVKH